MKLQTQEDDGMIVGLIASKNPVSALEKTVASLFTGGASMVIVVNDGSDEEASYGVFERVQKMGAKVIHLSENVGKAAALREGFKLIPPGSYIAQTDDDTLSGDLRIPMELIRRGKTDIADIRVETNRTKTIIGAIQELDYWMINAILKRLQDLFRARLWMSGASVMYSYRAGVEIILRPSHTVTEDTEGMFRARTAGMRVRFCSKREAQFITMVPEDFMGLRKQWRRWAIGNGQVIGIYGLGGGLKRVTLMNAFAWISLTIAPVPLILSYGIIATLKWQLGFSLIVGLIGAISRRRVRLFFVSPLLPAISLLWILHAIEGMVRALKSPLATGKLTWVSPTRTTFE